MSINEGIVLVAGFSGLWGVGVTFWQPDNNRKKVLAILPFVGFFVLGWWLTRVQSKETEKAEQAGIAVRTRLQDSLDQTLIKVGALQTKLDRVTQATDKPETADAILNSIRQELGKPIIVRGDAPRPVNPVSTLKGVTIKPGELKTLDEIMKASGYSGSTDMAVLTVYISDDSLNNVCVGTRPDLDSKNSHCMDSGATDNFQGGEDTSRVWVRSEKGGKIDIDYRPRR